MNFESMLTALKAGKKVTRKGWNGKGMFLWMKPAVTIKAEWCKDPVLKEIAMKNGGTVEGLSTICMKTADNKVVTGWLASQTDIFAEDWEVVDGETIKKEDSTFKAQCDELLSQYPFVKITTLETVVNEKTNKEELIVQISADKDVDKNLEVYLKCWKDICKIFDNASDRVLYADTYSSQYMVLLQIPKE